MAMTRLPAYTIERGGAFYWTQPSWANPEHARSADPAKARLALRNGKPCPVRSSPLGANKAEAITKADGLNAAFKEWCSGAEAPITRGTIAWLFNWYRETDWYAELSHKTRADYKKLMDMLVDFETKKGAQRLGLQMAAKVDAVNANKLYKKLREKGDRQAAYAM